MKPFFHKLSCAACACVLALSLSACGSSKTEPTQPAPEKITLPTAPQATEAPADPKNDVEHLSVVMVAGELYTLDQYPNLKSVDLSGSTCYDTILDFMSKRPHLDVTFTVPLGGTEVSNKETSVILNPGSFQYDTLLENLQYLPQLTTITFSDVSLDAEQVNGLLSAYPNITLDYSVTLFGESISLDTTTLDLSYMNSSNIEEACQKLGLMTNLTDVTLPNSFSFSDVDQLQTANPHIVFHYAFSLFGKTVNTADEEIIFKDQNIGNEGEDEIRAALKILDNCSRFVLDDCGLDYELLAKIREDFRDGPKVVWRVYFGKGGRYYNTLTDDDVIRCVENITDDSCGPMKYLEDVVHMDLGHNDTLSDLSFVGYMTKLETAIVSGCAVSDISGFENCKNLLWLEMAYCGKLKDISPLAGCENLAYLNLSYTGVSDYEPLDGLPLERFVCLSPKASTKEQNTFTTIHPKGECITVFYGSSNPYGYGWRYNDNGKTMFDYYKNVIREVFNYDQADAILNAQKKAAGK